MLELYQITKNFGLREVLQGVSMALPGHKKIGLIGPSGGGKSTLLKIIGQIIQPDSGVVSIGTESSTDKHDPNNLSFMFQEGALFDSLSVFDNLAFPLVGGNVPSVQLANEQREVVIEKVSRILARVGLTKAAHKFPAQLSGGMKRRASLARALINHPKLLLLDDPTCGLDPVASSAIIKLIDDVHSEYHPLTIIVSHDLRRLLPVVDIIVALFDGKICFMGDLQQLRESKDAQLLHFVSCRYDLHEAA